MLSRNLITGMFNSVCNFIYGFEFQCYLWEGLKKIFTKNKEIKTKIRLSNGTKKVYFRPNSSDTHILKHIFIHRTYDLFKNITPRLIIDGGANIGFSAIFFADKYPEATIIAVEPEKSNYDLVLKNTSSYKNIMPINAGLWGKETYLNVKDIGLDNEGFIVRGMQRARRGFYKISYNQLYSCRK